MFGKKRYGDYGRSGGTRPRFSALLLVAVVLFLAWFGYRKFLDMNLSKANNLLESGSFDESERYFSRVAGMPFSGNRGEDGLGVLDLIRGDREAAKAHFKTVLENKPGRTGADVGRSLQWFTQRGLYDEASIYSDFLKNWRQEKELNQYALDFAAIQLGLRNPQEAKSWLDSSAESNRKNSLSRIIETYENDGSAPVMVDRHGAPFLLYDLESKSYRFKQSRLFKGWEKDGAPDLQNLEQGNLLNTIGTTIDLNLQKAAHSAMTGYQGSLIMTDPKTGEILAAYGTEDHSPFSFGFEPGSVVKVLTYATLLVEEEDVSPYAPKNYPGNMSIGGKIFYDWTTQGMLNSVNEGMAVSCNLMFAQMGNDLGWSRLNRGLKKYFDGESKDGFPTSANYGQLLSDPEGAWDIGRAAIGLDFWSATVLGLVRIPNAIANGGQLHEPFLIKSVSNIEGSVFFQPENQNPRTMFSEPVARELWDSLEASVNFSKGTARRAKVDFVEAAMKTGTAGERPFDSIMIGFFPLINPRVAFSLHLDKGGKCEINGAKVARNLQEQIKALAPEYLEK